MNLLSEAKAFLRANWDKGTKCPCCGQYVKLYARSINNGLAHFLCQLYKLNKHEDFVHINDIVEPLHYMSTSHYGTLKYWGLIEQQPNVDDSTKKHTGYWRLTDLGNKFVERQVSVPKYAYTYNSKLVEFSEENVYIFSCFKEKFDYEKLMYGVSEQ